MCWKYPFIIWAIAFAIVLLVIVGDTVDDIRQGAPLKWYSFLLRGVLAAIAKIATLGSALAFMNPC